MGMSCEKCGGTGRYAVSGAMRLLETKFPPPLTFDGKVPQPEPCLIIECDCQNTYENYRKTRHMKRWLNHYATECQNGTGDEFLERN